MPKFSFIEPLLVGLSVFFGVVAFFAVVSPPETQKEPTQLVRNPYRLKSALRLSVYFFIKLTRTCVLHCLQYTPTLPLPLIGSANGLQQRGQNIMPSTYVPRGNAPSCLRLMRFINYPHSLPPGLYYFARHSIWWAWWDSNPHILLHALIWVSGSREGVPSFRPARPSQVQALSTSVCANPITQLLRDLTEPYLAERAGIGPTYAGSKPAALPLC